jgi:TRAP transporter 4TM/12TM fusion protein
MKNDQSNPDGKLEPHNTKLEQSGVIALDDAGMQQAQAILEETEFGGRKPKGWLRVGMGVVAVLWSVFQVYAAYINTIEPFRLGAVHLAFAFALAFLAYPLKRSPKDRIEWFDWLLTAAALTTPIYILLEFQNIITVRAGLPNTLDVWMGSLALVLILFAAYRAMGPAMPIIALVFVLYAAIGPRGLLPFSLPDWLQLHAGQTWEQIISQIYLTTEGIFGTPIQVAANTVFLFVLFGAMLDRAGAGQFFTDVAYCLLGGFRGGPAKVSVIASGLNGIVSGSSVSNVVTGGNITIGLMKRVGYPAEKAGAIEVASSSNGQLMPPVMGAAAFIMSDLLQLPYVEIIKMAALPALLAYATLLVAVDLEAAKLGLKGVPRNELPPLLPVLRGGWYHLIPMVYLVYMLAVVQRTPETSALEAIGITALIMLIQEVVRAKGVSGLQTGGKMIIESFETGARNMISIALATACAGIIVGLVTITGLGFGLTTIIETISGGQIIFVLILAMLASLLLGMGLPTTANYIVMASLVVPVIVNLAQKQGIDIQPVQAHFFAFYFGIMADSTPPVALAAYAASAIARSDPFKTGIQGFIYELRTALLAYMIFFNKGLLLIGVTSFWMGAWIGLSAFGGMVAFAAATLGYLNGNLNWAQRGMLLAAALLLVTAENIFPFPVSLDFVGLGLIAVVAVWQHLTRPRAKTV